MDRQEIEFMIKPDGTVEYTIKGVKGTGCEGLSKALATLGTVESSKNTSEYYERPKDAHIVGRQG